MIYIPFLGYVEQQTLIILGAGLLLVVGFFSRRGSNITIYSNLTLTTYDLNPEDRRKLVVIEGRKKGLIAAIVRALGFGKRYEIRLNSRFMTIAERGRFDEDIVSIPISAVTITYYGYRRSRFWLILGILGLFALIVPGALILYFMYWRNQTIEVRVCVGENSFWGFNFYKGGAGTFEKAARTASIINRYIHYSTAQLESQEVRSVAA
jgi:hypothetical protein